MTSPRHRRALVACAALLALACTPTPGSSGGSSDPADRGLDGSPSRADVDPEMTPDAAADAAPDAGPADRAARFGVPAFNPGSGHIGGTIWHVAEGGDDGADGSEAAPWATVAHALEQARPGDAIALHGGTYREQIVVTGGGEPGAYLTLMAHGDGPVVVDADGLDLDAGPGRWVRGAVHVHEAAYVRLSGLRVRHSADNGIAVTLSHHVVVEDCATHDTWSSGIGVWSSDAVTVRRNRVELACNDGNHECLTVAGSSDGVAVVDNAVVDGGPGSRGGEGIDIKGGGTVRTTADGLPEGPRNVFVVGNRLADVNRGCLYADAWDADVGPIVFRGNVAVDCDGSSMAAAGESGGRLHDVVFADNVLVRSADRSADYGGTGVTFAYNWGSATADLRAITAVNNTFVDMRWACGVIDADRPRDVDPQALVFANNLCLNRAGPIFVSDGDENRRLPLDALPGVHHNLLWFIDPDYEAAGYYTDPGFMGADALHVDPRLVGPDGPRSIDSLRLSADSPAIGAGAPTALDPAVDFDGDPRDAARPSIGAFEAE